MSNISLCWVVHNIESYAESDVVQYWAFSPLLLLFKSAPESAKGNALFLSVPRPPVGSRDPIIPLLASLPLMYSKVIGLFGVNKHLSRNMNKIK